MSVKPKTSVYLMISNIKNHFNRTFILFYTGATNINFIRFLKNYPAGQKPV